MPRSLNMSKLKLSLLLFPAVVILWASSAQAATITFDFRDATRTAESLVFEKDGLKVTATGFNSREDRLVHQSDWGLGVTAPGDSNTQIDGNPYDETLRLIEKQKHYAHASNSGFVGRTVRILVKELPAAGEYVTGSGKSNGVAAGSTLTRQSGTPPLSTASSAAKKRSLNRLFV